MIKDTLCWLSRQARYYWLHGVFFLLVVGSYYNVWVHERVWAGIFRFMFLYLLVTIVTQGQAAQRRNLRRDAVADADLQDLKDSAAKQANEQKLIADRQARIYAMLEARAVTNVASLKESLDTIQSDLQLNRNELADNTELTRKVGEALAKTAKR